MNSNLPYPYRYLFISFAIVFMGGMGYYLWRNKRKVLNINYRLFDSKDILGSGDCMDRRLIRMLISLEKETQLPIFKWINSGARSPAHNARVGGVKNSSHLIPQCQAVDIHAPTLEIQRKIAYTAKAIGFKRIGVGSNFIHLDIDEKKRQYITWGYPAGNRPPFNPFAS